MSDATPKLARRERPAANADKPAGALVFLHGRGADVNDLFPLLDLVDPDRLLHGVTLQAPDTMPGEPGFHWYVVQQVGSPHAATFHRSLDLLHTELDTLTARFDLNMQDVVVGGFSQGAVMSISSTLGPGRVPPAAVLPWSGFVPTVEGWELDPTVAGGVGVLLTHGAVDPVIPIRFGRDAEQRLSAAGAIVEYREAAIGHELDPETVLRARQLIAARFAPVT